jgi:hypothetical protein
VKKEFFEVSNGFSGIIPQRGTLIAKSFLKYKRYKILKTLFQYHHLSSTALLSLLR